MGYILTEENPSELNFDLGFGSRLFAWAQASSIAEKYGYTIVLPANEWVEHILLDLPNTECWDVSDIKKHDWRKLRTEHVDISGHQYWVIEQTCIMDTYIPQKDPLNGIQFQHKELNDFFSKYNFDFGLHLRRWAGVRVKPKDVLSVLNTLPSEKIKRQYYEMMRRCEFIEEPDEFNPSWISDSAYYQCLDRIIASEPNARIYLSTDIPEELYQYYLDRYPKNLITMKSYVDEWLKLISNIIHLNYHTLLTVVDPVYHDYPRVKSGPKMEWLKTTMKDVALDLLDFFMLTRCEKYLMSEYSQWADSAWRIAGGNSRHFRIGVDDFADICDMLQIDDTAQRPSLERSMGKIELNDLF